MEEICKVRADCSANGKGSNEDLRENVSETASNNLSKEGRM